MLVFKISCIIFLVILVLYILIRLGLLDTILDIIEDFFD